MSYRTSYRRHLTGAIAAAALIATMSAAAAQPAAPDSKLAAAINEAVKGLDSVPRLKKLSPEKKKQLVEFIIGNTLFVGGPRIGSWSDQRDAHAGAWA